MINNIRISVALCTYNGARYLRDQLDSIINQSLSADEIIIVDDCSTDESIQILKEYSQHNKAIRIFVNERNLGFLENFSLAISKTTGDYVALADQDDIWLENHIESLISNIGNNAICVGESELIDSSGNSIGKTFNELRGNYYIPQGNIQKAYRIIYNSNPYRGADMLIQREWVQTFLPIPKEVAFHDTFLSACAALTSGLAVINDIVSYYRIHEGQVTKGILKKGLFDELKRHKHHICYNNKKDMIRIIEKSDAIIPPEAESFINEFKTIHELDKNGKRIKALKLLYSHYKLIFSCSSYKYIFPRVLHFLLAP